MECGDLRQLLVGGNDKKIYTRMKFSQTKRGAKLVKDEKKN